MTRAQAIIASDAALWPSKLAALRAYLRDRGRVIVAVSVGIDSTFLWAVAHQELGNGALGVTGASPSLATWEHEGLARLIAEIGAPHQFLATAELDNPNYAANPTNRCFFCKDTLWSAVTALAQHRGVTHILDGYNIDDVGDHRPGQVAGTAYAIQSPLKALGFRKADIRAAAQSIGLSIWAKPAMACLSSRFAYGVAVDAEGLARVDGAERWLRERGFDELRVRVHGDRLARLELPVDDILRFLQLRGAFAAHCKSLGFLFVSLDLEGFRSGSMNAVLMHTPTAAS